MSDKDLMVSIRCLVFNHEKYLRQCLDGFVMQQTNFRFEAVVHDDASTDGSADIIREYAEKYPYIIKPIYEEENQYSKYNGSLSRIMNEACKGKYIAYCEGDDYWIDPLKLQKQVDYLENHLEFAGIHTAFAIYHQNLEKKEYRHWALYNDKKLLASDIVADNTDIQTCTILINRKKFNELYEKQGDLFMIDGKYVSSDIQSFSGFAWFFGIGYIDDVTAVYRIHNDSVSGRGDIEKAICHRQRAYRIRSHMAEKLSLSDTVKKQIRVKCNLEVLQLQLRAGKYDDANNTNDVYLNSKIIQWLIAMLKFSQIQNGRFIGRIIKLLGIKEKLMK